MGCSKEGTRGTAKQRRQVGNGPGKVKSLGLMRKLTTEHSKKACRIQLGLQSSSMTGEKAMASLLGLEGVA